MSPSDGPTSHAATGRDSEEVGDAAVPEQRFLEAFAPRG